MGEIIKIKKEGALFALTGDKLSLSQINTSKSKKKYVVESVKYRTKDSFVGEIDYSSKTAFLLALKNTCTLTYLFQEKILKQPF